MVKNTKQLTRSKERLLGGVCAGIADYYNKDVNLIRLTWIVLTVLTHFMAGIIIYIAAWFLLPDYKDNKIINIKAKKVKKKK